MAVKRWLVMCYVVRFCVGSVPCQEIGTMPRDWLGRTSLKGPILCRGDAKLPLVTQCVLVRRQRFVVPALYSDTSAKLDALLAVRRSVDELRDSLSTVLSDISETQALMRAQQRHIDDIVRTNSLHHVCTSLSDIFSLPKLHSASK